MTPLAQEVTPSFPRRAGIGGPYAASRGPWTPAFAGATISSFTLAGNGEPKGLVMPRIRSAVLADADPLFELAEQFAASFRPQREAFDISLRALEADPAAWLAVAEQEGEIVGYCLGFGHFTFFANGRVAWVEEITVRPECRRQGIGAQLMEAFEEWARSCGAKLVALATRRAAPFYTALGYEESASYFRKVL